MRRPGHYRSAEDQRLYWDQAVVALPFPCPHRAPWQFACAACVETWIAFREAEIQALTDLHVEDRSEPRHYEETYP